MQILRSISVKKNDSLQEGINLGTFSYFGEDGALNNILISKSNKKYQIKFNNSLIPKLFSAKTEIQKYVSKKINFDLQRQLAKKTIKDEETTSKSDKFPLNLESEEENDEKDLFSQLNIQVNKQLINKQKNKSFKDTGEFVNGARKQLAALRKLSVFSYQDLENLDSVDLKSLISKKKILKDIDFEKEFNKNEISTQAAYLIKGLIDGINNTPKDITPQKAYLFQQIIPKILDFLIKFKTYEEINNFVISSQAPTQISNLIDLNQYEFNKYVFKGKERTFIEEILSVKFYNLINRRSNSAVKLFIDAKSNDSLNFLKQKKEINKQSKTLIKESPHDFKEIKQLIRKGGKKILEKELLTETLINEFGIKSVQFGNSMNNENSLYVIKASISSLRDLEDILNIKLKNIFETIGLSLAFGARGSGRASAHYEPVKKIINLTKSNGDGSFFHEIIHAIDFHLGQNGKALSDILSNIQNSRRISSDTRSFYLDNPEKFVFIKEIFEKIKRGGTNRSETKTIKVPQPEVTYSFKGIKELKLKCDTEKKDFKYEFEKYFNEQYGSKLNLNIKGNLLDYLKYGAQVAGEDISVRVTVNQPQFYYYALSMSSPYWQKPVELLARAAQSYLNQQSEKTGIFNNYLNSQTTGNGNLYPQEDEINNIKEGFDLMFNYLRKVYN